MEPVLAQRAPRTEPEPRIQGLAYLNAWPVLYGLMRGKEPERLRKALPSVLAARLGLERQWLHAVRLGFVHPTSGDQVSFTSPYPADLEHALELVQRH